MSAYYDLYQTPNPSPEDGEEKLLHARILPKGTIPADKFRELVHKATGFSPAILDGTLQAITDELHSWLADGWIVEVGELGFFSLSLKCDKAVANKKDIRSPSVHFQNVNLRISSRFRQPLSDNGAGTESISLYLSFQIDIGGAEKKTVAAFE